MRAGSAAPACQPSGSTDRCEVSGITGGHHSAGSLDQFISERLSASGLAGLSVAVINQNRIVYAHSAGLADRETKAPVTEFTIFEGASITKPLFGHFVMTFVAEGVLDLDRPLYEYLAHPELQHDERHRLITARMVLSHQTGLPNWRADEPDRQLHFRFTPGHGFSYSGEAFQYLAMVLQEIAGVDGRGLEAIFQQRIALPAGMQSTQIIPDAGLLSQKARPHLEDGTPAERWVYDGAFGAAYGVNSNAPDFAQWLISLMCGDGAPADLPGDLVNVYLAPQGVNPPYAAENDSLGLGPGQIALGFFLNDVPGLGRIYHHDGNNLGFSSLILMHPDSGWGFVAFSNSHRSTAPLLEIAMFINSNPNHSSPTP